MAFGLASLATGQEVGYPPVVEKRGIYARQDLRGKPAPSVLVTDWIRPADAMKGKVVIVHFFLPSCASCRSLATTLTSWQKQLKADVVVVGLTGESVEAAKIFAKETNAAYAIGVDTKKRTQDAFGVLGFPMVAVYSPDGIVRWQGWPGDKDDPLDLNKIKRIVAAAKASN